jgi:hypothetical protein
MLLANGRKVPAQWPDRRDPTRWHPFFVGPAIADHQTVYGRVRESTTKMATSPDDFGPIDDLQPEYDFRSLRGKYATSHQQQGLEPADDDDLIDRLLESNPSFRALVAKSKASPRRHFPRPTQA